MRSAEARSLAGATGAAGLADDKGGPHPIQLLGQDQEIKSAPSQRRHSTVTGARPVKPGTHARPARRRAAGQRREQGGELTSEHEWLIARLDLSERHAKAAAIAIDAANGANSVCTGVPSSRRSRAA